MKRSPSTAASDSTGRHFRRTVAAIALLTLALGAGCGVSTGKKGLTVGAGVSTSTTDVQDTPNNTAVLPTPLATSAATALSLAAPSAFGHGLNLAPSSRVDQLQYVSTTYGQAQALISPDVVWRPFDGVSSGTTTWVIQAIGSFQSDSRGLAGVSVEPAVSALVFVAVDNNPGVETYRYSKPLDLTSLGTPVSVPIATWSAYGGPPS